MMISMPGRMYAWKNQLSSLKQNIAAKYARKNQQTRSMKETLINDLERYARRKQKHEKF